MKRHNCVGQCANGEEKRQNFEELMKVELGNIIHQYMTSYEINQKKKKKKRPYIDTIMHINSKKYFVQ